MSGFKGVALRRPTFSDVAPQCNLHYQPFVPAGANESLSADLLGPAVPIRLGTLRARTTQGAPGRREALSSDGGR
jgi:hypothetical protein